MNNINMLWGYRNRVGLDKMTLEMIELPNEIFILPLRLRRETGDKGLAKPLEST